MDERIPVPQVHRIDARREAIRDYTARFLYLDERYAQLARIPDPTAYDLALLDAYDKARRIVGRALLNERKVTRW